MIHMIEFTNILINISIMKLIGQYLDNYWIIKHMESLVTDGLSPDFLWEKKHLWKHPISHMV